MESSGDLVRLFWSDCTRRPLPGLCSLTGLEAVPGDRSFMLKGVVPMYEFRTPAEPSPPPVKEPIEPPENPDMPIREPDPEDPDEI